VQALFFNHLYDPNSLVRDNEVKAAMAGMGVACQSFNSDLLFEPWEVLSDEGEPLTCFQEYWDKCALLSARAARIHACLAASHSAY
jgi:cryptochrome 1